MLRRTDGLCVGRIPKCVRPRMLVSSGAGAVCGPWKPDFFDSTNGILSDAGVGSPARGGGGPT